jgi:hypothetical protein
MAFGPAAVAQFETRSNFFVPDKIPYSVAVGDFDRDGILDFAEVNTEPAFVEILLGNGDGTFRLGASYAVDVTFYAAAGSLRRNGILDLVFGGAGSDDVYVMLGNGDGTFHAAIPYPATAESYMVGLGDFTGNGRIDVVATEGYNTAGTDNCSCVEVLLGNGDGTFRAPITTPLPNGLTGYAIAIGDFNNDGKLDVAVVGEAFPNYEVAILLGNGDGTFSAGGDYLLGAPSGSIATGYFTGDKKRVDLAVTNESALAVLLGNGDGTFQQPVYYDTNFPTWVVAQDLDGDGKTDLAASNGGVTSEYPPGVTVFKGNGDGTFQTGAFYPAGRQGNYVATGDFNGDHKPDLATVDSDSHEIITLLNTGVASFSPTTPLNFGKQDVGITSAPQTVTLTNRGSTELKIQSIKASAEFAVTSTCGARVAPGANCKISATFSPTKQGAAQGTISIIDNASTKPQVIELLGTGT